MARCPGGRPPSPHPQVRARTERYEGDWDAPSNRAVQREVEAAFAQVRKVASGGRHQDQDDVADAQARVLEPSQQELAELRAAAAGELMRGETTLITSLDPKTALRVFGERLVRRARQLKSGFRNSLMTYGHR
ncbi:hypothetical protein [Streptomyces sp. NPDC047453]|uniref:hypothetical protein n=1 Tax=Streptomyces sp. NPDC047453 TaxID=3154812 RepID=UPI0033FB2A50